MKYASFLIVSQLFLLCSFCQKASASCSTEPYTLTELLCNQHEKRSIFICRVDSTVMAPSGEYRSYATVLEVFRGLVNSDKIILRTGGNTTAGGDNLDANEEYLVFGYTEDGLVFGAFVCDVFSRQITHAEHKYSRKDFTLPIVRDFFEKQKAGYSGKVSYRWDDKIFATGSFKRGKPHGKWQHYSLYEYWQGGTAPLPLSSEGKYCKGNYDGIWRKYFTWNNGGLRQIITYSDDKILREVNYSFDKDLTYKSSELEHGIDEKGMSTVHEIKYYLNKNPKEESSRTITKLPYFPYVPYQQYYEGPFIAYYENGQIKEKGQYHLGAKVGSWFYWNQFGAPLNETIFERPDTTLAPFSIFYSDGKPMLHGNIENGKPTGEWKGYREDSNLYFVKHFAQGIEHGLSRFYWKGVITREVNYVNGQEDGPENHFREDGKTISQTTNYMNGKKQGEFTAWFPDGSLSKHGFYENDLLTGDYIEYSAPGKVRTQGPYVLGYRHGYFEEYEKDGRKKSGEFYLGQKVGIWESFYSSGKLESRCVFSKKEETSRDANYWFSDDCEYFPETKN